MAVKGKYKKRTATSKSTLRHRSNRRRTRHKRRMCIRGGSYEKDVTTRTLENYPMKPLNKVVTTVPGRGVMSAAAYMNLMEDIDRNGNDYYD